MLVNLARDRWRVRRRRHAETFAADLASVPLADAGDVTAAVLDRQQAGHSRNRPVLKQTMPLAGEANDQHPHLRP